MGGGVDGRGGEKKTNDQERCGRYLRIRILWAGAENMSPTCSVTIAITVLGAE